MYVHYNDDNNRRWTLADILLTNKCIWIKELHRSNLFAFLPTDNAA